jgi:hypothetical protein
MTYSFPHQFELVAACLPVFNTHLKLIHRENPQHGDFGSEKNISTKTATWTCHFSVMAS